MTGDLGWKDMTRVWGKLFGTNWAYCSHYVGGIFGVALTVFGLGLPGRPGFGCLAAAGLAAAPRTKFCRVPGMGLHGLMPTIHAP